MSTSDTALLDDIFESVTAAEAEDLFADVNPDGAANSCDDDDIDFSDPEDLFAVPPTTTPSTSASTSTSSALRPQPRPTPPAYRTTGSRSTPVSKPRAPLHPTPVNRPVSVGASAGRGGRLVYTVQKPDNGADSHYFIVQYRKPQQKKHKTWDGDAFIKVEGSRVTMMSDDGKHMATTALTGGLPGSGTELRIGNWDCEVDHAITYEEFKRSTSCLNNPANAPMQYSAPGPSRTPVSTKVAAARSTPFKGFKAPTMVSRPVGLATPVSRPASPAVKPSEEASSSSKGPIDAASFYAKPKPAPKKIVIGEKSSKEREAWGGALHDPNAEGAVVMPRPSELDAKRKGTALTDVVIDPLLSSKMREHQKKGVEFMYRCVMGMAGINGQGCILADEMGLGKTLQTIALIYTLCKQSPWQNESSVIGRALVVCPVSLVHNWKKEFRKWLPRDFGVVAIEDADESKVTAFTHHRGLHVLIIGYERLRKVIKRLASCQPPIGLIVCDEGHRLKSKDNKTTKMFDVLSTPRRIMLTGTPVQNDLGEYWAMAEFCNPGVLGTYSQFNRQFEKPITKAREPRCKDVDAALGQERMSELYDLTREFVIRRTADVLDKYLPPKTEYVVFVAPTTLQLNIFTQILGGGKGHALLSGQSKAQLATIHLLRKVANSPLLLRKKDDDEDYAAITSTIKEAQALLCPGESGIEQISGKMKVLDRILRSIADARGENEKIVVVSNWTSTLDLVQDLCIKRRYNFLRLDGSTPQKNRQEYVDRFNRGNRYDSMVFLLSAKAGGVGLNLIGASRLVLFDSDWNPSTDLQAMARIHRDGQKKPVYIYRLLTTNTIDEKIYQRQITKTGLSDQMMGGGGGGKGKESKDSFSFEELRDIFSVNLHTDGCQTHDLLGCDCEGKNDVRSSSEPETREPSREASPESSDEEKNLGFLPASQFNPEPTPKMRRKAEAAQQAKLAALKEWRHLDAFNTDSIRAVSDNLLYNLTREDYKTWDLKNDVAALKAETSMTASTSASSRSDTPEGPAAKKRKGLMEVMDAAMAEALNDSAANSQPEDSDDEVIVPSRRKRASQRINESPPEDSEEEAVVPSRHKRASTRLKEAEKNKLSSQMFIPAAVDRKHNVRTLAEQGQGGRIMYVFEKVSKSGFE